MPKIDNDCSYNKREVAVELKQYEVIQMIEDAALKTAGIKRSKAVTINTTLTKTTDSSGYERSTESLAVGARVKIIVDNDYVEEQKGQQDTEQERVRLARGEFAGDL
jgi:hypothetical protein